MGCREHQAGEPAPQPLLLRPRGGGAWAASTKAGSPPLTDCRPEAEGPPASSPPARSSGTMEFSAEGYIQEFTRHSSDVLLNLNELRKRQILTDVCLLVDGRQLKAHKAVLMACSGFFYSVFLSPGGGDVSVLPLPDGIELRGFQALLDFMYTSRLALSADSIRSVLAAAEYLRMDHVMETCRRFIHTSYDHTGFHLAPAGTLVSTFPAPPQDREGLNLHAREVQGVLPLPPNAGMASPPTPAGFPAGSVVRSTKSWTRSLMMGLGGIRDSGCSFQKALVPPSDVGEDVVRLQAGPVLSHPAESGSLPDPSRGRPVQSMLEERSMSVVMATEGHQAGQGGPTDRNLSVLTPDSPTRSDGHPNSPTESSSCGNTARCHSGPHSSDPKAWNWKKYKFIVLNSLKQEEAEEQGKRPGSLAASVPFPPEGRGGATSGEEDSSGEEASGHHGLQLGFPARPSPLCIICDQRFQGVAQLRHHVLHGHPGEEPSEYPSNMADYRTEKGALACGACELRFQDEEELQRHFLHVHDDEKPYKCSSCMAAFRYKGNLASHRAAHSGEKPYHCGVCGAQFNRPANLKTHARIHSGEKPYKCETCGSRFVQVAHLRAHVLIHTGEKPYPCETCGTRFRHLQTLKSHIRIHTGEKPYHCETCDLHFRHKSQLRLHLRQKHGAITNTKIRYKVLSGPYAMTAASF